MTFLRDRFLELMTNGMFASAFTAFLFLVASMIIIHFSDGRPTHSQMVGGSLDNRDQKRKQS